MKYQNESSYAISCDISDIHFLEFIAWGRVENVYHYKYRDVKMTFSVCLMSV